MSDNLISRVARRYVSAKIAAVNPDPKKAIAKVAGTLKKRWEKFIADFPLNAKGQAQVFLKHRPMMGGYGPYEMAEVDVAGSTSGKGSWDVALRVKFIYDYKNDTFSFGVSSGPHPLRGLGSGGVISFKDAPAHFKKLFDFAEKKLIRVAEVAPSSGLTADGIGSRLRSIRLGPGGKAHSVDQDSATEWTVEPSNRQRLDHYGSSDDDDEGWNDGWYSDYAEPVHDAAQKWLDEEFGSGMLRVDEVGEKGHVYISLTDKGKQTFKI
jgi:hypothetical protein